MNFNQFLSIFVVCLQNLSRFGRNPISQWPKQLGVHIQVHVYMYRVHCPPSAFQAKSSRISSQPESMQYVRYNLYIWKYEFCEILDPLASKWNLGFCVKYAHSSVFIEITSITKAITLYNYIFSKSTLSYIKTILNW